jgi:hypothetical protein
MMQFNQLISEENDTQLKNNGTLKHLNSSCIKCKYEKNNFEDFFTLKWVLSVFFDSRCFYLFHKCYKMHEI